MSHELFETMHVYTWAKPVFVAFVDILGFQAALDSATDAPDLTFGLWRNCLPLRSTLSLETPKLNFVQMSDSLVIYGDAETQVLDLVCNVFGAALIWGVPIRGGIGYGVVNHAEDKNRPGTIVSFYGGGLNDAYKTEQQGKGRGMRLLFSEAYLENAKSDLMREGRRGGLREYPWWLRCGIHSSEFAERSEAWWSGAKSVGRWFAGGQRADTKSVFERAMAELKLAEQV